MRVLLVEDEDRLAAFVIGGLRAEGHAVDHASTLAEAHRYLDGGQYDVVLLDLLLPDGHGRALLRGLRARDTEVPVIVLSALGTTDDKVGLLDEGADDYLVKPFEFAELVARIRAATRHGQRSSRLLCVGDLALDTKTRIATRGNLSAELPSREFALLEYLMRHPGQVLTRQQILDAVWGFGFESASNVVDVYVGYLRRKLDRPGEPSVIETIRGAGYRVRP
ncbi:MAG: response regulator transcription factor [Coriobacteriia bacterium]|nr:response regulator transcription factor [Coriobacteriia bacterium]